MFWNVIGSLDCVTDFGLAVWPTFINLEVPGGSSLADSGLHCFQLPRYVWLFPKLPLNFCD